MHKAHNTVSTVSWSCKKHTTQSAQSAGHAQNTHSQRSHLVMHKAHNTVSAVIWSYIHNAHNTISTVSWSCTKHTTQSTQSSGHTYTMHTTQSAQSANSRINMKRINCLLSSAHSSALLPQWHSKDSTHSAKGVGQVKPKYT